MTKGPPDAAGGGPGKHYRENTKVPNRLPASRTRLSGPGTIERHNAVSGLQRQSDRPLTAPPYCFAASERTAAAAACTSFMTSSALLSPFRSS